MISLNSHFIWRTVVPGEDGVPANHDDDRNEETAGTAQILEDRSPARQDGRRSTPEAVKRLRTGEAKAVTLWLRPSSNLDRFLQNTFHKGSYIIRQGTSGDTFYIISEGQVKITKRAEGQ